MCISQVKVFNAHVYKGAFFTTSPVPLIKRKENISPVSNLDSFSFRIGCLIIH